MSYLIQPIQIVLVFDNANAFDSHFGDLQSILPRLTAAMGDFGPWNRLKGYETPNHLGLATDTRHITVQRYDEKMDVAGFADVLANPLVANAKPALAQAIMEHQRAFLVEVGTGSVPGFATSLMQSGIADALGDLGAGMGMSDNQVGYENRLFMTQTLAAALIKEMAPSAIHWVQSQQVFNAPTFTNLAADGFSLPLYCGPFIFGGQQLADGSVKAGVRALGSQNLLGKMVIFKPDVQDWAQSHMQILAFIVYCRTKQIYPSCQMDTLN